MCYEIAIRPKRNSDDIFFIHGDRITLHSSNDIAISYIEEGEVEGGIEEPSNSPNHHQHQQEQQQSNQQHPNQQDNIIICSSPYCNEIFTSIKQSQLHYELNHCFQCHQCTIHSNNNDSNNNYYYNYPNEHLLDLHLKEIHDIYYKTGLQQKKIQYTCLVMTCNSKFYNDHERFQHLINDHGYPIWFRFHSRCRRKRMRSSSSNRNSRKGKLNGHNNDNNNNNMNTMSNKTKQWWYNKRMNYNINSNKNNNNMDIEDISSNDKQQSKKQQQQRKERKKELNKNIPCRFYNSKSGCWRGKNCMFLHSKIQNDNEDRDKIQHDIKHNNHMDICTEIDILANEMNTKANISIPDNISFGRRRRR